MSTNFQRGACAGYPAVIYKAQTRTYLRESGSGKRVRERIRGPYLARQFGGMVLWATILFLQGAGFVGSVTGIPGVPENITVMFLNPTSVRVSWSTSQVEQVEKYDVTYKPTDARVVVVVAGNSEAVTLSGLRADTQYQLVVTAVRAGKKFRSRPIVFRTLEPPRTSFPPELAITGGPLPPPPPSSQQPQPYIQVRGVEVGIVVLVLIFWAGAIALFFNRWGKIRMLLPYQPDYKEQLKVPGTGVCAAANAAYTQHPTQHTCSQHLHWSSHHVDSLDSGGGLGWPRTSRPRVNSAIDVAGFLSQEFLRRHGSTSKLCRKVRSADNLPLASTNRQQDQRNSKEEGIDGDKESFLRSTQEEKCEDSESKRQSSLESCPKDNPDVSLLEPNHQLQSSRDSPLTSSSSFVGRRFGGWRAGGSHEYVRCPVRQPASMDERLEASDTTTLNIRVFASFYEYLSPLKTALETWSHAKLTFRVTLRYNIPQTIYRPSSGIDEKCNFGKEIRTSLIKIYHYEILFTWKDDKATLYEYCKGIDDGRTADFYVFMKNLEARGSKEMRAVCKNVYRTSRL